jgi:hypothetical protein
MQSDVRKTFYFQTDANPLGGFIEKPFEKNIPSHASSSLPNTGGYIDSRGEDLNFEDIVSVSAAYTRLSGREVQRNGPWSILVTSVVEGLNILEVVTAERVVAQISATYYPDRKYPKVSLAGSHFEGLRIGGYDASPVLNPRLLNVGCNAEDAEAGITWPVFQETGRAQAGKLVEYAGETGGDADRWIVERFGWMNSKEPREDGLVLCSLVDSVEEEIPGRPFGWVVVIPDFGRVFLGELLVTRATVQLSMVRAELGCNVGGQVTGGGGGVGGHTVPPS